MGQVDLPQVEPKGTRSLEEYVSYLANVIAMQQEEISNFVGGRISSENMREIAGYNVSQTELKHKSGIVGMSGADPTDANAIRFWAGDDITGSPKFIVTQGGILTAVAMILKSALTGQKVTIDETGLHAYDENEIERITIGTTPAKGAKALITRDELGVEHGVYTYDTENVDGADRTGQYIAADGSYILLGDDGRYRMQDVSGRGFRTTSSGYPEMNDGFGWVDIAKAFTGFTGSFSTGTQTVTVSNGIITSVV